MNLCTQAVQILIGISILTTSSLRAARPSNLPASSRPVNVRRLSTAHRPRTHGLTDERHHDLHARSSTGPRAPHVGARALHDALYAKRRARVETAGTPLFTLNWMPMQDLTEN